MSISLDGKSTVITGAGKGIGAAIATLYAESGARVLAVDADADALGELARRVTGVDTLVADVLDPAFPPTVLDREPDVLVNNVGDFLRAPTTFVDAEPGEWEGLAEINLGHALRLTHALLPGMIARGRGGSIINLTTVEAHRGIPGHVLYSTYKAALRHFTRSLALELGRYGIRVNAIAPDLIETPQVPYARIVAPEDRHLWSQWAPLGGPGQPEDVAGPALFLASELSRFMTGTTLHVDGGTHAAGGWFPRADGSWTNRPRTP